MARRSTAGAGVSARLVTDVWAHLRDRDQRPRPKALRPLRIVNEGDVTRIDLMDEIGYWGTTAQDFVDELLAIDSATIELHVNSPGGDVFDGVAIMNALADHPATVNVVVDGLAASAASYIALGGDTVKMNRASQMMIHDAAGMCWGNAADMEEMKALLDRISDTIAGIYADRAGGKAEDWRDLMRAETWYSATEAVDAGLADVAVAGPKSADEDESEEDEDAEESEETEDEPAEEEGEESEEEDPDEDDEEEGPAAKFAAAFSRFTYAGRAQAPAPPIPGKTPVAHQFDPAVFRAAIREGVTP